MQRVLTAHTSRHLLYEQLQGILERLDRVLPTTAPEEEGRGEETVLSEFNPARHAVIEAEHAGICKLQVDPKHWRFEGVIPSSHSSPSSKRWFLRRMTQHASAWDDGILRAPDAQANGLTLPPGMRLWHETEEVRKILILTKHDLQELFKATATEDEGVGGERPRCPRVQESNAYGGGMTLLATPRRVLGFAEGLSILRDESPYLTKTCLEYARILCYLYGLSMAEFHTLSRMSISRRLGGTPIALQECGGGLYDSGPWASAQIGTPYISHDLSPTLMPQSHDPVQIMHQPGPVRVRVAEGVLTVMDGHVRACYSHGYTQEPREEKKASPYYYTIDFFMDSMKGTELLAYVPQTWDMIMQTPVVTQHAVERTPSVHARKGVVVVGTCALLDLVRVIRARLQTAESKGFIAKKMPHLL